MGRHFLDNSVYGSLESIVTLKSAADCVLVQKYRVP